MLDENFSSDGYAAILGNLKDKGYLNQDDVDILINDSPKMIGVGEEKAEIIRRAVFENCKTKSK